MVYDSNITLTRCHVRPDNSDAFSKFNRKHDLVKSFIIFRYIRYHLSINQNKQRFRLIFHNKCVIIMYLFLFYFYKLWI